MLAWLLAHGADILAIYGGVVAAASTIVKLTPSTKDDAIVTKIINILDYFSVVFKASDAKKLLDK